MSQEPKEPNRAALASSVQTDFRALIELFSRDVDDSELRAQLASAKTAALRGLVLANQLIDELNAGKDQPQSR